MKTRLSSSFDYEGFHFGNNQCSMWFTRELTLDCFVPDLIVFDTIVVDTKVIDKIADHERGLMLNYLRISKLRVGLILNFKHGKLEWERLVL